MVMDYEATLITTRYMKIIRDFNTNLESIRSFREEYPHILPPNIIDYIEHNLKECVTMLYRELDNIGKPAGEKKQYVCKKCHMVFMAQLPGGICDKCRSETV